MTFEYTNIKKSVIAYKKYTYALNKKRPNNGGYYFRCVTTDCSASLLILNDRIITEKDYFEHSHFPALPIYSEYQVMLGKLKIQIVNEQLNISEVKKRYNDIYKILENKYSREQLMPHWDSWSKKSSAFRKLINKKNDEITVATNSHDIILAEQYKTISGGHPFLRVYDQSTPYMIFYSNQAADCLRDASEWHFDGSFKAVPIIFKQILTIIAVYNEIIVPCAFIFLPNKLQITYQKAFESVILNIKDASQELKLTKATTDFESGLQNSIAIVFNKNNNITIKACWFHFNQAIIRRISMLGLKMRYINDQDFRFWVRKFTALALIPEKIEDLEKAWGIIICETPTGDEELVDKFIKYFIDTWLLGRHGSHCIPSIWNRHKEKIRTNNNLEGYHSMMNKSLNPHSKITDVIDFFKTQDQKTSYEYLAEKSGKKEAKCYKSSKKINIDFDEKLEKIQSEYDNLSFEEYFYKLSFHVAFGHKKKSKKKMKKVKLKIAKKWNQQALMTKLT